MWIEEGREEQGKMRGRKGNKGKGRGGKKGRGLVRPHWTCMSLSISMIMIVMRKRRYRPTTHL